MARREVERALKKQRLQAQSRALREELVQHARGVEPVFKAADAVATGWRWLKAHPMVPVAVVAVVVVVKPALVWRVGQGAWVGWKAWQRWRPLLAPMAADEGTESQR